jgi:hypothetical protein
VDTGVPKYKWQGKRFNATYSAANVKTLNDMKANLSSPTPFAVMDARSQVTTQWITYPMLISLLIIMCVDVDDGK